MTIEDPVEYIFPSINQIQINEQAGITFAGGLQSILRQDPDVILVGEIRDVETARIAVQSALTGHFVLSSLHATDAVSALLPAARHGHRVVPHRLVGHRRASPSGWCAASATHCREPYQPDARGARASCAAIGGAGPGGRLLCTARAATSAPTPATSSGSASTSCSPVTDEIRELIVDRAPHDEMRKVAQHQGMRTLQEEAVRLVEDGVTTIAEVMRSIYVAGV